MSRMIACEPWPCDDEEAPLCRNASCAELGIQAVDEFGFCRDCHDARADDAAEAAAEAARERFEEEP